MTKDPMGALRGALYTWREHRDLYLRSNAQKPPGSYLDACEAGQELERAWAAAHKQPGFESVALMWATQAMTSEELRAANIWAEKTADNVLLRAACAMRRVAQLRTVQMPQCPLLVPVKWSMGDRADALDALYRILGGLLKDVPHSAGQPWYADWERRRVGIPGIFRLYVRRPKLVAVGLDILELNRQLAPKRLHLGHNVQRYLRAERRVDQIVGAGPYTAFAELRTALAAIREMDERMDGYLTAALECRPGETDHLPWREASQAGRTPGDRE